MLFRVVLYTVLGSPNLDPDSLSGTCSTQIHCRVHPSPPLPIEVGNSR